MRVSYTHEGLEEAVGDEVPGEAEGRRHGVSGGEPQHEVHEDCKGHGQHHPATQHRARLALRAHKTGVQ